jgi:flagellar biosynthesis regulator FlbT
MNKNQIKDDLRKEFKKMYDKMNKKDKLNTLKEFKKTAIEEDYYKTIKKNYKLIWNEKTI